MFFILFKNLMQIHLILLLLINVSEGDLKNEALVANASVSANGRKSVICFDWFPNSQQPQPIMVLHAKYFPINSQYVAERRIFVPCSACPFVYRHYFMEKRECNCAPVSIKHKF